MQLYLASYLALPNTTTSSITTTAASTVLLLLLRSLTIDQEILDQDLQVMTQGHGLSLLKAVSVRLLDKSIRLAQNLEP